MMSEPHIPQKSPMMETLEPDTYFWCACGKSADGKFCDGSHQGTGLGPVKFEIEETKTVALCGCKHSKNGAFCDGSHASL